MEGGIPYDEDAEEDNREWLSFSSVDRLIEKFLEESVNSVKNQVQRVLFHHRRSRSHSLEKSTNNITEIVADLVSSLLIQKEEDFVNSIEKEIESFIDDVQTESYVDEISGCFSELKKYISKGQSEEELARLGYTYYIRNSLIYNFQVHSVIPLIGQDKASDASVSIRFDKENQISMVINKEGAISLVGEVARSTQFHGFRSLVYLESPFFWKLKNPLELLPIYHDRVDGSGNRALVGVPDYFYDASYSLRRERPSNNKEAAELNTLANHIEHQIGGELKVDPLDHKVKFYKAAEHGGPAEEGLPPLLAATGIFQLGIIGLLIKDGHVSRGTVLFIDEPEAHLHTAWQEKFMEVLFSLVKYGVNIVMATHSPVMMQKLGILYKDTDQPKPRASLNLFSFNGEFDYTKKSFEENLDNICDNLEQPAYEMYISEL